MFDDECCLGRQYNYGDPPVDCRNHGNGRKQTVLPAPASLSDFLPRSETNPHFGGVLCYLQRIFDTQQKPLALD